MQCVQCGASGDPSAGGTCAYCGAPQPRLGGAPLRVAPTTLVAAIVGGVFLLSVLGVAASWLAATSSSSSTPPPPAPTVVAPPRTPDVPKIVERPEPPGPATPTAPPAAEPVPRPPIVRWDSFWSAAEVVTDGEREVLIAPMRAGDESLVIAYDIATTKELWRVALARIEPSSRYRHFVVAADRLVTADDRAMLRVYDLADGRLLHETHLTDRVDGLCRPAADPSHPWIRQIDDRKLTIDVATFALAESALPKHCTRLTRFGDRHSSSTDGGPRIQGLVADRVLVLDDVAVMVAHREPGTRTPEIVGFDPETKTQRWRQPLSSLDPLTVRYEPEPLGLLTRERYVGVYETSPRQHRLTAFAARTGERLWEIDIDSVSDVLPYLEVSASYVIVGSGDGFDVYRGTDGQQVGRIP